MDDEFQGSIGQSGDYRGIWRLLRIWGSVGILTSIGFMGSIEI